MITPNQLRRELRAQRRDIPHQEHRRYCRQIVRNISNRSDFRHATDIALFFSNDGEPDLDGLIERVWHYNKRCYLPVLRPGFQMGLWFAPWDRGGQLKLNRFGIPEPDLIWRQMRPAWSLDMVLMPLVGFDSARQRLGMGGGYYDRTFAFKLQQGYQRSPPHLLGVAFEVQKVAALSSNPWDVPLDGVVTEAGCY